MIIWPLVFIILILALNEVFLSIGVDDTIDFASHDSVILKKQKEDEISSDPKDSTNEDKKLLYDEPTIISRGGILPAFAIVRCRWKKIKDGDVERTIHFWVRGRGRHVIEWQTWNDYDGDGEWDLWGPDPPVCKKWTALVFPIRHYSDRVSWSGYSGNPKIMIKYWLDGRAFTKTFSLD
jgi:hypothetical protein